MANSEHIQRQRVDPLGLDFDSLKKDGVASTQALSGKTWTDYNAHDPGVTILEQLCFGITELAYRSGFDIRDYLAGPHGAIDFERLGLYRPELIYSGQAVTVTDYCKLLFAAIPDLDDVYVEPLPGGLYHVEVRPYQPIDGSAPTDAQLEEKKNRVRSVFAANRNLGEDLESVRIIDTFPCYLQGEIEIHGNRPPAEIYAEVFFRCARKISSDIRIQRYEDVLAAGRALDDIFTGPFTAQGYIADQDFAQQRGVPTVAELVALIARIDGVKQVRHLRLVNADDGDVSDAPNTGDERMPSLQFPGAGAQRSQLRLVYRQGSSGQAWAKTDTETVPVEAAKLHLQKLEFEYRAFRDNPQMLSSLLPLPRGHYRPLADYYSIQNQFPPLYGINRAGIPGSAATATKARAKQLKGYLYPLEQLMANYLQDLQQLPRLFSLDASLRQSYFAQPLGDAQLPGIQTLYADTDTQAVARVLARHDNFCERRSRVLDVLLAMYGEEFSQEALQRFNYYRSQDSALWLLENKIHYLKALVDISGRRAGAADVQLPTAAMGGWQKRIGILLALTAFDQPHLLCQILSDKQVQLLDDERYDALARSRALPAETADICAVPLLTLDHPGAQRVLSMQKCVLSRSMLCYGTDISHYKLLATDSETTLYFQVQADEPLYRLASRPKREDAILSAHHFRNGIIELNQLCEGFHVLEHILLRPDAGVLPADDFFAFRFSLLFPAWTARFADVGFRKLAEEIVCRHSPAHLLPTCHWLELDAMQEFEQLQQSWLATEEQGRGAAAAKLVAFLQNLPPATAQYWL